MKKSKIVILLILLGIIFFISLIFVNDKIIVFELNGNSFEEINIGDEYEEEGFDAKYCNKYLNVFCKDLNEYVNISERVVDNYKFINYSLNYKNNKKVITRKISYVDKESPEIKLEDDDNYYCNSSSFIEKGYSAFDNVDGDITNKVVKTLKDNKIYYSVTDSSGNKKVIFRKIDYSDIEAPKISLIGADTIYLFLNQNYIEKGYTAVDNCDGNITNKVIINNNLDNTKEGEYEIKYTVTDSFNNISSLSRKIIVYKDISEVEKNGKVVYLTFDDGPGSYTEDILNVLNKYNVKATFFVTNQFSNYQDLIKKEYDSGHTVAVHTYSHNYKNLYKSVDDFLNDFNNINQIIYEQTGNYSNIFRFPGGSSNTISRFNRGIMTELVIKTSELGYHYFDWNVDSLDTMEKDPNKIFENVKNEIEKNEFSVVLMHDIKKANIESVEKIIKYGLENGYTFLPLDENSPQVHHSINN